MAVTLLPGVFVVWTVVALGWLLLGEAKEIRGLIWLAKPLASAAFVAAAATAPAVTSGFGRLLLVAFLLSFAGDVLLIPKAKPAFLAGLGAFLVAHLVFAGAFVIEGQSVLPFVLAVAALGVVATFFWAWISPHLPPNMRIPVAAYVSAIVLMCSTAIGTIGAGWLVPLGAVTFVLSDLFVARDRFVARGFVNRACGLPLYYAAQLVLAASLWS